MVYVVKADNTVEMRPVSTGSSADRKTIIQDGLKPGATVVIDGHLSLFPGAKVKPVDNSKIDAVQL